MLCIHKVLYMVLESTTHYISLNDLLPIFCFIVKCFFFVVVHKSHSKTKLCWCRFSPLATAWKISWMLNSNNNKKKKNCNNLPINSLMIWFAVAILLVAYKICKCILWYECDWTDFARIKFCICKNKVFMFVRRSCMYTQCVGLYV